MGRGEGIADRGDPRRRRFSAPRIWTQGRIEEELLDFIPGDEWPSQAEFAQRGRLDLAGAVGRNGGVVYWARKLGFKLRPAQDRTPYSDLHARTDAAAFIKQHGYLPSPRRLREQYGEDRLARAVRRAGGTKAFLRFAGLPESLALPVEQPDP